jgi:NADH-quinone oxidoreductase subunit E
MTVTMQQTLIPAEICQQIDQWLTKFPADRQRSGVLYALRLVQKHNGGWLSVELMDAVADYLALPKIAVYEVVSFYSMYERQPVGKNKIAVCTSISCMLNGCEEILEHLENRLGTKRGESTKDGKFYLKEVECLAACVGAPMLQVNDKQYYENLTLEKVDAIIDELSGADNHG